MQISLLRIARGPCESKMYYRSFGQGMWSLSLLRYRWEALTRNL